MCAMGLLQASWRQCSRDESGPRRPLQTCAAATLTVAAKMACAVVGDSGVVALLLVGPFRALPACASSTRFDTCMECSKEGARQDDEGCMQLPQDLVLLLLLLLLRHTDDCTQILNQPGSLPVAARITNTVPNRHRDGSRPHQCLALGQRQPLQEQLVQLELGTRVHGVPIHALGWEGEETREASSSRQQQQPGWQAVTSACHA